jgi:hypothetical protein
LLCKNLTPQFGLNKRVLEVAKELFDINGRQAPRFSINNDLSPYDMAPSFFSYGNNVRFLDGKAGKILGHIEVLGTPAAAPYWATGWLQGSTNVWIYGTATSLRKISGVTHSDVTRSAGAYTTIASTTDNWQGDVLGGVLVVCNGIDAPQSFTQAASVFADLTQWPSTLKCKAIVPFKNHLIALNLTDSASGSAVAQPFTIRWSDAIPAGSDNNGTNTWVTSAAASESGETSLMGTKGHVLNAVQLGNLLMIYKEDSVYSLNYVGGAFTFNIRQVFKDTGLFSRDSVVDLGNGKHVMMTTDDVVVHDGNSIKSIIDDQMKTFLFSKIDSASLHKTFMVHNKIKSEVWICFPVTGATGGYPNLALIWNYVENTWATRDLPSVNYIAKGVVNPVLANTWAAATTTWKADTLNWGQAAYNPAIDSLLMIGTNDTKLYLADSGVTFNGTNFTTTLERRGLNAGRTDAIKQISRVYPRIEGTGTVSISVGAELAPNSGVVYNDPVTFTIGTDNKVDCRVKGRYAAIKIESDAASQFRLSGYAIEAEVVSDR